MMVWLDDRLQPAAAARIAPTDRGLLLGDGLFETIRLSGGAPSHLSRHLARLSDGAAVLDLPLPWTDAMLAEALAAVAAANPGAGSLRLTVTRGPAPRGLLPPAVVQPTLLITAAPAADPLPPARLILARSTCRNAHSPLSRIKSLNYGDGVLARQEAARAGADDALLLNTSGMVAEATAACLFLRRAGRWITPPVADGALPGIARGLLLEAGFVAEERVTVEDLAQAESAFLANSLGLRAVAAVEGHWMTLPELALTAAARILA
jgi:branched-chain amino acid aminotransferase